MVSFVLKTAYHGDLRRSTFESVNQVSFEGIREFVGKSYDLSNFLAKYQDEEGDWCTLTAATLGDALDLAKEKQVLRLEIHGGASPLGSSPPVKRSPSLSSWEMLDLDEDEEMDSLENATSVQDPTVETNETDSGVEGSPPVPEADDSESDGFLIHETSSVAAETVEAGDECVLVEQAASLAEQESTIHESIAVESDQEMIEEDAEAETLPLPNAPAEAELDPQPGSSVSTDEKINLILAAFDKNGDGRLNFEECIDLLVWASGELIPFAVFKLMCDELRVQPQDGFGSRELGTLYNSFGTLERDFQAALRKLSTEPSPSPCPAPGAAASQWNLRPWMALPLLPICPVAAGALALAATLRNRACQ